MPAISPTSSMIEQKYTTTLKRIGAAIVDAIVFLPLLFIQQYYFEPDKNPILYLSWLTFTFLVQIIYSILLHKKYGQTIGKWVTGVKVVDISEDKNISLIQSIRRTLCFSIVELAGLLYLFYKTVGQQIYSQDDYENVLSISVLVWVAVEFVVMLSNKKRRTVHDIYAKSVVVKL
ncbi:MAG: RDD family protein [Chitinophagaceae bacterium]|nr:RDD family protein [Chitinophagaceae bacterium]